MLQVPTLLKQRIQRRQCVAFVGAGFSMACGMPGWRALLAALLERAESSVSREGEIRLVESAKDALSSGSLPLCASLIRQVLTSSELDLAVREQFDLKTYRECNADAKRRMTERLKNLVGGPWAGIITTNYDELIEYSLARWGDLDRHQSSGADNRLGIVLANAQGSQFFVKLHGGVGFSEIVLSTEEYDRTYMGSAHVTAFLTAVMLNYHIVFIGCSLEDELVRLRRKLCMDFGGVIPMAYALMPGGRENLSRSTWLRDRAQLDCIFYPEDDLSHESLDRFLTITAALSYAPISARFSVSKSVGQILKQPLQRRLRDIGLQNRSILIWIASRPKSTVSKEELLDLSLADGTPPPQLGRLTSEERIYRALFLVSVKLLDEKSSGERTTYAVSAVVKENLSRHE
jgi:hypothetical protein